MTVVQTGVEIIDTVLASELTSQTPVGSPPKHERLSSVAVARRLKSCQTVAGHSRSCDGAANIGRTEARSRVLMIDSLSSS